MTFIKELGVVEVADKLLFEVSKVDYTKEGQDNE